MVGSFLVSVFFFGSLNTLKFYQIDLTGRGNVKKMVKPVMSLELHA